MAKYSARSRYIALWVAGCTIILGLVTTSAVVHEQRSVLSPLQGAAMATYNLSTTTQRLQQSFASLHDDPKATTVDYIVYMDQMQQDCHDIQAYKAELQQTDTPTEVRQLLNSSTDLCADLTMLASNSKQIYSAVYPVLSTNAHIKRYQMLPFIKDRVKTSHETNVAAAITNLNELDTGAGNDYPSSALPLLEQLRGSISNSQGLEYVPSLRNFQNQILAERQHYWTSYAGMSSLQAALKSQLRGYCQAIDSRESSLEACNDTKD